MRSFEKYMLIKGRNLDQFNGDVTDNLQRGWVLYGQLTIIDRGNGDFLYFREMVRESHSGEALEESSGGRLFQHFNEGKI